MRNVIIIIIIPSFIFFGFVDSIKTQEVDIEFISSTLWKAIVDVNVKDSYAYCAMGGGLLILDVTDPSEPIWHSQLPFHWGSGIDIIDNLAFYTDSKYGLKIVDITNPGEPVLLGGIDTPDCNVVPLTGAGIVGLIDGGEGPAGGGPRDVGAV